MRIADLCEALKGKALIGKNFRVVITPRGIRAMCKAKYLEKTFWALIFLYSLEKLRR